MTTTKSGHTLPGRTCRPHPKPVKECAQYVESVGNDVSSPFFGRVKLENSFVIVVITSCGLVNGCFGIPMLAGFPKVLASINSLRMLKIWVSGTLLFHFLTI